MRIQNTHWKANIRACRPNLHYTSDRSVALNSDHLGRLENLVISAANFLRDTHPGLYDIQALTSATASANSVLHFKKLG